MKSLQLLMSFILVSHYSMGQNFPACDSLVINCCTYNTMGVNTVSLEVSNNSSVLFDYPGFILFDANMDTIAVETVNYFGIGNGFQTHTMNITAPLNLPFTGFLNLYILFYDSLACSFPITLPDTTTGLSIAYEGNNNIEIYPNPISDDGFIKLESGELVNGKVNIKIISMQGIEVINQYGLITYSKTIDLNIQTLLPGVYVLKLEQKGVSYTGRFFKLE